MVALWHYSLASIRRCWTNCRVFFGCHLSLHSCNLESPRKLQQKCERNSAGKSIRWRREKRKRHSHLKTRSNAPAGTSTSLGDRVMNVFTAGTVTETIPSLSVLALAPQVSQARLLINNCLFQRGRVGIIVSSQKIMDIETRFQPKIFVDWYAFIKTCQGSVTGKTKDISVDGVCIFPPWSPN